MSIYIAEIAGKDSISAVLKFMRNNQGNIIIPSIVFTGTEYGEKESYFNSINYLKECSGNYDSKVEDVICLSDYKIWNCLNVKFQYLINMKFGFYTPCIMCHFFAHMLRIPLLRKYNAKGIITGERYSHKGIVKTNQHKLTIEGFKKIFMENGINIIQPLLYIEDTEMVDQEIKNMMVLNHANDLKCLLSGNLYGFELDNEENLSKLLTYIEEFVIPIGNSCIKEILVNGKVTDEKLSNKILEVLQ